MAKSSQQASLPQRQVAMGRTSNALIGAILSSSSRMDGDAERSEYEAGREDWGSPRWLGEERYMVALLWPRWAWRGTRESV